MKYMGKKDEKGKAKTSDEAFKKFLNESMAKNKRLFKELTKY